MPTTPTVPRVLQVDAVVTDSAGTPVPGLKVADFDLALAGKSIPITSFTYARPEPRRLILIVDDALLSFQGVERARAALTAFVNGQMQPGDEAAIVRTSSGGGVLESITSDKHLLAEAITRIDFNPANGAAGKSREELVLAAMASTLHAALAGLNAVPGRKAVVLISENLGVARMHADRFRGFDALAAKGSAVFYGVDLSGSSAAVELDTLMLAGDTGGLNLGPGLPAALQRVLHDQEGCYLLSYQSEESAESGLKVSVKLPDLFVRSRTSPLGSVAADRDFRSLTPTQELTNGLNSAFNGGAIHMLLFPLFGDSRSVDSAVTAQVWVNAEDLAFTHLINGTHRASAQVMLAAFSGTGANVGQAAYNISFQLNGDEYQKVLKSGWTGQTELPIRTPGAYLVRAAVRDEASSRMGTASQLVEVPDLSNGELALSGIVVQTKDYATFEAGPAGRIFARGAILDFAYKIFNPSNDQGKSIETEATLHFFRGTEEIFSGTPQILASKPMEDLKRRSVVGQVKLGPGLSAGHYWMQVTVAEKHPEKARRAQQWIDFQVRP